MNSNSLLGGNPGGATVNPYNMSNTYKIVLCLQNAQQNSQLEHFTEVLFTFI